MYRRWPPLSAAGPSIYQPAQGTIKGYEATKALMINRFFTQSSRMLVLSMQALIRKNHLSPAAAETVAVVSR
ncbi:hypothetical protein [Desulfobulbus alkaliphilus]|uniref:hypothetical protein n=1 Tax=Desulfobulbus alkaliphilus TaxID=869814 RepID=UPI001963E5D6|nr:hypothetical protein [Desulfobulbus alkaliphilus]MBM9536624.1 hypothetical protein [Desulfobulbus alkaliphilus]